MNASNAMTERTKFVFDPIAPHYDRCNHLFSFGLDRRWREALVRAACPQLNEDVLDICTGTGDVVFDVLRYSPARKVTGIDLSEPMIHLAQEKQILLGSRKWMRQARLCWKTADIMSAGLADGGYDLATCAFGIRNIADRSKAFHELNRLLRPNGRLAILEFSLPSNPLVRLVYRFYLQILMPVFGRAVTGRRDALRYLSKSIVHWHTSVDFRQELSAAGFNEIRSKALTLGIVTLWLARKDDQRPYGS
ncbi:MAG: ubiquinone/menaquinone biosynthesis methyltransferase [Planctomycetaceae bacterium]|nr:ubiquinone/menaquinone biosynthesis methyltransferase [Planctomycetaceae bacterium]